MELCSPFVQLLPISGASISVFDEAGHQSTICASDAMAARLEELQFSLGEGPHWKTLRTGAPTLVPDLKRTRHDEWPIFGAAMIDLEVGALFAFPLAMGAVVVGVVDLYRETPGPLTPGAVSTAMALAGTVAGPATRSAVRSAEDEAPPTANAAPEMRRVVHQATGMLLAQLDISATEAFFRLKAHAFATNRSLEEVAQDVVLRRIDFTLLSD
jgi:GAF domain-containing protein